MAHIDIDPFGEHDKTDSQPITITFDVKASDCSLEAGTSHSPMRMEG